MNERPETDDVLIVGAGVIGLACAWRAARAGLGVRVLERDRVAAGASGVAAGMLAPVGEAHWGEGELLALGLASLAAWDDFAAEVEAESSLPTGYERAGALHVALDRDEAEALRRRHELHVRHGLDSEWLRPSGCRELEPGLAPGVSGGLHAPGEATVDPALLCAALAAAARSHGAVIEEGAEVRGGSFAEEGAELELADGSVRRGRTVVLAAGCWSGAAGWVPPEARPPVRPVKGEILTLRGDPADPVCSRIVAGERAYLVPRSDGRLIVGATVEEHGFDATVTAGGVHELLREAYRLVPEIAELELVEARAGLRPGSPDNAPLIGASGPSLIVATGHYRNGVLLAPVSADAVLALLQGVEPDPVPAAFSPDRFAAAKAPAGDQEVAAR
jgi:glycine oxidase